jgi:hypothetical protein
LLPLCGQQVILVPRTDYWQRRGRQRAWWSSSRFIASHSIHHHFIGLFIISFSIGAYGINFALYFFLAAARCFIVAPRRRGRWNATIGRPRGRQGP